MKNNAMTAPQEPADDERRGYVLPLAAAVAVLFFAWLGYSLLTHKAPVYAMVLATPQDCLRTYAEGECNSIVERAYDIQAATAPNFAEHTACERVYGLGQCRRIFGRANKRDFSVPLVAVILLTRDWNGAADGILPLYIVHSGDGTDAKQGESVFYREAAVGRFLDHKFGGANISTVLDLQGRPFTNEGIRRIRRL